MSKTVDIHIFKPGKQTSAQGVTQRVYTDLQQVVDSYDDKLHDRTNSHWSRNE